MKKSLVILILLAMLTMAQQCNNEEASASGLTFRGGTTGLSIEFIEGAPPEFIYDGGEQTFDVGVKLLNLGEEAIAKEDVILRLTGINPTSFGKTQSDFIKYGISEDIPATRLLEEGNLLESPPIIETFPNLGYAGEVVGNNVFPIRVDVCYAYKTTAQADACIRSDVLSTDDDAVCVVNEAKQVVNSGAPVQVTEFVEMPQGTNKVRYVFKINHASDKGRVYLPGSDCPTTSTEARANEDKLHFRIESELAVPPECSPISGSGNEGTIRLIDGEATVYCVQDTSGMGDSVDKVKIYLTYDYKDYYDTEIEVRRTDI